MVAPAGFNNPYAAYSQWPSPTGMPMAPMSQAQGMFPPAQANSQADKLTTQQTPTLAIPAAQTQFLSSLWFAVRHPRIASQLSSALSQNLTAEESLDARKAMAQAVVSTLSSAGRKNFLAQLQTGRLTDTQTDNGRSTLSHLYAMVSTPRAQGISGKLVAEETLRLLNAPQTITQKFSDLTPQTAQQLLNYYQQSGLAGKMTSPLNAETLKNVFSATCVASSVMYYMVKGSPGEFARHIAELTSPSLAFEEKASAQDISPENPMMATQKLADFQVSARPVPGSQGQDFWIKTSLPQTGLLRALNQVQNPQPGTRGLVESVYQDALTHLVERSYEPGLSMRQDENGQMVMMDGLIEEQKTLLESIIRDNGGVVPITYQFTAAGQENEAYLMGYFRNFEQTQQDLLQALNAGNSVIVGYVETDPAGHAGRLDVKHEVLVTGFGRHPQTGELMFTLADSDDGNPNLTQVTAREFIPKIHHAGFPAKQAFGIIQQIQGLGYNRYGVPSAQDAQRYTPIATVPRMMQPAFLANYDQMMAQAEAQQQAPMAPAYGQPNTLAYA